MIRFARIWRGLRRLARELWPQPAVRIPGKYPWSVPAGQHPPYGQVLFEDANFRHITDGVGGVVSHAKKRSRRGVPTAPARRRRPF